MDNTGLTTYKVSYDRVQEMSMLVTAPDEATAIYAAYDSLTDDHQWNPTDYANFSAIATTATESGRVWTRRSIDNYYFESDPKAVEETSNRLKKIVERIRRK